MVSQLALSQGFITELKKNVRAVFKDESRCSLDWGRDYLLFSVGFISEGAGQGVLRPPPPLGFIDLPPLEIGFPMGIMCNMGVAPLDSYLSSLEDCCYVFAPS